jgi:sigma-E factor negative regulatory protein RseB
MRRADAARLLFLGGICLLPPLLAHAQADAMQWLQRAGQAAKRLSYTGTFVYQSGKVTETSRITHLVDAAGEAERLEVLDGSPREVVRINDEVQCFLPEKRTLIVERRPGGRGFPALLPASFGGGIGDYYVVKKAGAARVAGLDTQSISIEPRDELRYGHQWWVDTQSGLLVKASRIGEGGEPLETFAFTELRIGGPIDREAVKPAARMKTHDWRVQQPVISESRADDGAWNFRGVPAGFRKVSGMKRQARADAPAGMHWVFSDGLAAVSVFVDPAGDAPAETGFSTMGALNVYKRLLGEHLVVVMGDVPRATLKRLGDGVEGRRK